MSSFWFHSRYDSNWNVTQQTSPSLLIASKDRLIVAMEQLTQVKQTFPGFVQLSDMQ